MVTNIFTLFMVGLFFICLHRIECSTDQDEILKVQTQVEEHMGKREEMTKEGCIKDHVDYGLRQVAWFSGPDKISAEGEKCAELTIQFAKKFMRKHNVSYARLRKNKRLIKLWRKWYKKVCPTHTPVKCNVESRYASADGSCNNLKHPRWGQAHREQRRFLKPKYDDSVGEPRIHGKAGLPLPSARLISNKFFNSRNITRNECHSTVFLMAYGQTIIHDMVKTPTVQGKDSKPLECCGRHADRADCFPIQIPDDDEDFIDGSRCLDFSRSLAGNRGTKTIAVKREQLNSVTAVIDGSVVYGSDSEKMKELRTGKNGLLKTEADGRLLPRGDKTSCSLANPNNDKVWCQNAGDSRVNVVSHLSAVQTVLVLFHNVIAGELYYHNPDWNDEILFQETRKIVAACLQHITYNEFLPALLGRKETKKYKLFSKKSGFATVYNKSVDSSITNEFAAAAFRVGHTFVPNIQAMKDEYGADIFKTHIHNVFHKPKLIQGNNGDNFENLLRWTIQDKCAGFDRYFVHGIRNKLFPDDKGRGMDLSARNIQRGRDHGIPGYNAYRKLCGLATANITKNNKWLMKDHPRRAIRILQNLYGHLDDIDLYVGGISEKRVPGGVVGPTFACLIGRQFRNTKIGDRFWYENDFPQIGFTRDQVNEIKKITMAGVICQSTYFTTVQKNVFKIPSSKNPTKYCNDIPTMDFTKWGSGNQPKFDE